MQGTIEAIQEQRKYNAYCTDFKRYLRHKNGEYSQVDSSVKTEKLRKAQEKKQEKKRMKQVNIYHSDV
jgi:hypothetical protein